MNLSLRLTGVTRTSLGKNCPSQADGPGRATSTSALHTEMPKNKVAKSGDAVTQLNCAFKQHIRL